MKNKNLISIVSASLLSSLLLAPMAALHAAD